VKTIQCILLDYILCDLIINNARYEQYRKFITTTFETSILHVIIDMVRKTVAAKYGEKHNL
jgi:hypothetical protein